MTYGIIICPICIPSIVYLILNGRKAKEEIQCLRIKINMEGIWVPRTKFDKDKLFVKSFEAILWEDILDVAVLRRDCSVFPCWETEHDSL